MRAKTASLPSFHQATDNLPIKNTGIGRVVILFLVNNGKDNVL